MTRSYLPTTSTHAARLPASTDALDAVLIETAVKTAQAQLATEQAAVHVAQKLFGIGGTSTALKRHNFDRHWRNARSISLHDPIVYCSEAIDSCVLRGDPPPLGFTY